MKGARGRAARARGQTLEPTVFVGRGGVTDAVAAEVKAQLEARDLVKVRLDRAQAAERGRKEMAEDLASRAGAELVEVRGFMVLLARGGPRP